jgi:GrpB-like predicted nucleotidyltransferase (UPF0157 family)
VIAEYDDAWPERFCREAGKIQAALGEAALVVEHIGSTAVPGLAAKPIGDVLLVVEDSGDEASYAPAVEASGYVLRVRERDFLSRAPDIPHAGERRTRARLLARFAWDRLLSDAARPSAPRH